MIIAIQYKHMSGICFALLYKQSRDASSSLKRLFKMKSMVPPRAFLTLSLQALAFVAGYGRAHPSLSQPATLNFKCFQDAFVCVDCLNVQSPKQSQQGDIGFPCGFCLFPARCKTSLSCGMLLNLRPSLFSLLCSSGVRALLTLHCSHLSYARLHSNMTVLVPHLRNGLGSVWHRSEGAKSLLLWERDLKLSHTVFVPLLGRAWYLPC